MVEGQLVTERCRIEWWRHVRLAWLRRCLCLHTKYSVSSLSLQHMHTMHTIHTTDIRRSTYIYTIHTYGVQYILQAYYIHTPSTHMPHNRQVLVCTSCHHPHQPSTKSTFRTPYPPPLYSILRQTRPDIPPRRRHYTPYEVLSSASDHTIRMPCLPPLRSYSYVLQQRLCGEECFTILPSTKRKSSPAAAALWCCALVVSKAASLAPLPSREPPDTLCRNVLVHQPPTRAAVSCRYACK